MARMAISEYIEEVQAENFPGKDYSYPLKDEDLIKLHESPHWNVKKEATA